MTLHSLERPSAGYLKLFTLEKHDGGSSDFQGGGLRMASNNDYFKVRKHYLMLCDHNMCAAVLLNYFQRWYIHCLKLFKENKRPNTLQFHTQTKIREELFYCFSVMTIRKGIRLLVEKGFIELTHNPDKNYAFDNKDFYIFKHENVREGMHKVVGTKLLEGVHKSVHKVHKVVGTIEESTKQSTRRELLIPHSPLVEGSPEEQEGMRTSCLIFTTTLNNVIDLINQLSGCAYNRNEPSYFELVKTLLQNGYTETQILFTVQSRWDAWNLPEGKRYLGGFNTASLLGKNFPLYYSLSMHRDKEQAEKKANAIIMQQKIEEHNRKYDEMNKDLPKQDPNDSLF